MDEDLDRMSRKELADHEVTLVRSRRCAVNSVAFAPDGRWIASANADGTLTVWEATSGREVETLTGHRGAVNGVAFSPDGKWFISGSVDKTLKLWETGSWREVQTLKGNRDEVLAVAYSPDGRYVVSGSKDDTLAVWESDSGKTLWKVKVGYGWISFVAVSPDGKWIGTRSGGERSEHGTWQTFALAIWNAASGKLARRLKGDTDDVECAAFSRDGRWLASGNADGTVTVWEAVSGLKVRTLNAHKGPVVSGSVTKFPGVVSAIAFSPDSKWIISGSFDSNLKLWDVVSGKEVRTLVGHTARITAATFSLDGRSVASSSDDGRVCIWDLKRGPDEAQALGEQESRDQGEEEWPEGWEKMEIADTLTGPLLTFGKTVHIQRSFMCVSFSPDGRWVASGSSDSAVRVWLVESAEELWAREGGLEWVTAVAFSPDGRWIVAGGWNGRLQVYEAGTGIEVLSLKGHANRNRTTSVCSVAFSPDGRWILSGDYDLKLWEAANGAEVRTLQREGYWVRKCAFSPDGRWIVSGAVEGTLKLWDLATGRDVWTQKGHEGGVEDVCFSPNGKWIASTGGDNRIKLWEPATGKQVRVIRGAECTAFSPDSMWLLSGGGISTVSLWEVSSGKHLQTLKENWGKISSAAFSPDRKRAAVAGSNGWLQFLNIKNTPGRAG